MPFKALFVCSISVLDAGTGLSIGFLVLGVGTGL